MANKQRIEVELGFQADTSKAKQQIEELNKSLKNVAKMPGSGNALFNDNEIKKASKAAMELQKHLRGAFNTNTGKLDVSKLALSLKSSGQSLKDFKRDLALAGEEGKKAFQQLTKSIADAEVPTLALSKKMEGFLTTLKNTAKWQISSSIIHGLQGGIQKAYGYAQDLNESLNKIRIVTGESSDQMAKFAQQANKAAKQLSTTTTAYTDAALIFYQQGLTGEDVTKRTDTVIKMANVTGESASEVSSYMTAIWNNFADGADNLEHFADVITALGATTAASSAEISEGLEKFAAIGKTVGLSYEYATSALATVVAETRQSADIVGTAFKTIFSRLQGLQLGETLEDGLDLNKYSKALDTVGVRVLDATGQMRKLDDILDDLAVKWNTLSNAQQTALAQTVAGTRQYSQLIALMNSWDKMKINLGTANNAEGTLQAQADIYAESWEAAQKRVKAAAQDLYSTLINDEFFIKLTDGFKNVIEGIKGFINGLGGVKGLLLTLSSIFMQNFAKKVPEFFDKVKQNFYVVTNQSRKLITDLQKEAANEIGVKEGSQKASEQLEVEGIKEVTRLKEALIKNSKFMTVAQQEEAKARIENIENMYKENVALQEQVEKLEKLRKEKQEQRTGTEYLSEQYKIYQNAKEKAKDKQEKVDKLKSANDDKPLDSNTKAEIQALEKQIQELYDTALKAEDEIKKIIGSGLPGRKTAKDNYLETGKLTDPQSKAIKEKSDKLESSIYDKTYAMQKGDSLTNGVNAKISEWKGKGIKDVSKIAKEAEKYILEVVSEDVKNMAKKGNADFGSRTYGLNVKKVKDAIDGIKKASTPEELRKALEDLENAIKDRIGTITNEINKSYLENEEEFENINGQKRKEEVTNNAQKKAEVQVQAEEGAQNTSEAANEELERLAKLDVKLGQVAGQYTAVGMSVGSLISSIDMLNSAFSDEATVGQKVMAVMGLIMNTMNAVNAITKANASLEALVIKRKAASALATGAQDIADKAHNVTLGTKLALQTALNIVMLAAVGAALIAGAAMAAYNKKLEENAKEQQRIADNATKNTEAQREEAKQIEELSNKYEDLNEKRKNQELTLGEFRQQVFALCVQYGEESLAIQALTADYNDLNEAMRELEKNSQQELADSAEREVKARNNSLEATLDKSVKTKSRKGGYIKLKGADHLNAQEQKDVDALAEAGLYVNSRGRIKEEELLNLLKDQDSRAAIMEALAGSNTALAKQLRGYINDLDEELEKFDTAENTRKESLIKVKEASIKTEDIKDVETYNTGVNELTKYIEDLGYTWDEARKKAEEYYNTLDGIKDITTEYLVLKNSGFINKDGELSEEGKNLTKNQKNFLIGLSPELRESIDGDIKKIEQYQKNYGNYYQYKENQGEAKTVSDYLTKGLEKNTFKGLESEIADSLGINEEDFKSYTFAGQVELLENFIKNNYNKFEKYVEKAEKDISEYASEEDLKNELKEAENKRTIDNNNKLKGLDTEKDKYSNDRPYLSTLGFLTPEEEYKKFFSGEMDDLYIAKNGIKEEDLLPIIRFYGNNGEEYQENDLKEFINSIKEEDLTDKGIFKTDNFQGMNKNIAESFNKVKKLNLGWTDYNKIFKDVFENNKKYSNDVAEINEKLAMQAENTNKAKIELLEMEAVEAKSSAALASKKIDEIQSAYSALKDVQDSYNATGKLTFDNIQSILSMEPEYLAALEIEDGQIKVNTETYFNMAYAQAVLEKTKVSLSLQDQISAITSKMTAEGFDRESIAAKNLTEQLEILKKAKENVDNLDLSKLTLDMNYALTNKNTATDKKDYKKYSQEFDRFYPINKNLENISDTLTKINNQEEFLFGANKIAAIDAENEALAAQATEYEHLYDAKKSYLEELQDKGSKYNVVYTADGDIDNYGAITKNALDRYNAAVDTYNSSGRTESDKKAFDLAQKDYEEFKQWLSNYQSTISDVEKAKQQIDESIKKSISKNLEKFKLQLQLDVDVEDARRTLNEFLKKTQEDFKKVFKTSAEITTNLQLDESSASSYQRQIQSKLNQKNEVDSVLNNKNYDYNSQSAKFHSREEAIKYAQDLSKEIMSDGEALFDLYKSSWDGYLSSMDEVIERWDDVLENFEDINEELEHYSRISELLYGGDETVQGREYLAEIYEAQKENSLARQETLRVQKEAFEKERADLLAAGAKETDNDVIKLTKAIKDADKNMRSEIESYLDTIKKQLENAVKTIKDTLDKNLFGGSISDVKQEWEDRKKQAEGYYDEVEKIYQLESLQTKWNKAINDTTSLKTQKQLTELMERQQKILSEKTYLSKLDVELAEKELAVYQAQIALEEAQNNKNSMKMVRDGSGNWSYQYVADEDDIAQKQQDVADRTNEWREASKAATQEITENTINAYEEFSDRMSQIYMDVTLSEEEREEKVSYLNDLYFGPNGILTKAGEDYNSYSRFLSESTYTELWALYAQDAEQMRNMTNIEKDLLESMKQAGIDSYFGIRDVAIGGDPSAPGGVYGDLILGAQTLNTETITTIDTMATDFISRMATDEDSVKAEVLRAYSEMEIASKDFEQSVHESTTAIGIDWNNVTEKIDENTIKVQQNKEKVDELLDDTAKFDVYRKLVDLIGSSWKSVQNKVVSASQSVVNYAEELKKLNGISFEPLKQHIDELIGKIQDLTNALSGGGPSYSPSSKNYQVQTMHDGLYKLYTQNDKGEYVSNGNLYTSKQLESMEYYDYNKHFGNGQKNYDIYNDNVYTRSTKNDISNNNIFTNIIEKIKSFFEIFKSFDLTKLPAGYNKLPGFDTGGYTGDWNGGDGRLAILHSKELVLNAEDTKNMLTTIEAVRDLASAKVSIQDSIAAGLNNMLTDIVKLETGVNNYNTQNNSNATTNVFNINPSFPNAANVNEIREALLSLPNLASQYLSQNKK